MLNKEFLESYPLYKKFYTKDAFPAANDLQKVNIKMHCPNCKSHQTFNMVNNYWDVLKYSNASVRGKVLRLTYLCAYCKEFERYFAVFFDADGKYIMKVGQYPAWSITLDKNIKRMLGEYSDLYKKGLICESQSYGLGAFAYYRRIIEDIINKLLEEISELLVGEDKIKFDVALKEAKKTTVTQDKIKIVKDLLPPILKPNGMNPLSELHSILSKGLHAKTDDECNDSAMAIREIITFLVNQVELSKESSKVFTNNMKRLLKKKSKKP